MKRRSYRIRDGAIYRKVHFGRPVPGFKAKDDEAPKRVARTRRTRTVRDEDFDWGYGYGTYRL